MAFRLPTLTIAVCVVLWVPQLALDAQQPTANFSPPIERVPTVGENQSANPLRHRTMIATTNSPSALPQSGKAEQQPAGKSREEMREAIPPEVRKALYPHLTEKKKDNVLVQAAAHLEPVGHSTSRRQQAVKQLHRPIDFPSAKPEPTPTVMATDFSRLPKPSQDSIAPLGDVAKTQNLETADSLLAPKTSTAKQKSGSSVFSKKLAAERSGDLSKPEFQDLLGNIAGSTCLVLILGVGFILVAKRVTKGKVAKTKKQKSDEPQINVVANLRLTPKSDLHLVEIGRQRVLVASDAAGIKSVVSLTNSFASQFDSLDDEIATEAAAETTESSQEPGVYEKPQTASQEDAEIEAEMRRKLSELLGGQAFKDVFYQSTRAVA